MAFVVAEGKVEAEIGEPAEARGEREREDWVLESGRQVEGRETPRGGEV